ncbi:transcriptional regulator, AraC family [Marvinbryantia formatexigens DSM 14469]|uniref:Transcriptional regulator, AraC family n=1 Tax=Marvinbryantia formatexigens DSM 14469 TaxID=478749 RepID=C6LDM6_9FIRM|nr:AraC family transcriptional regulator [Marvinbryantia formatexigens]EET61080.1 transcriptional regulator, AraC family [Marvinbryantia formatexigens DSM 14469]UWO23670.1 AraC family transcriptional regulator [Marvinbryantia formatexigens DSM 14469]SDF65447.1 AraC-type DNA-binding protein [Marvinbryantia formatexigens]
MTSIFHSDAVNANGQELKQHGTGLFPCGCYNASPEVQVPWHWHEEYECSYVFHGAVTYHTPQGEFRLGEGDGIFLNSGTLHTVEVAPAGSLKKSDLVFHGRLIYGSRDSVLYQKYVQPLSAPDAFQTLILRRTVSWHAEILSRIKKAVRLCQNEPEGYEFTVRSLLSEIFFDLYCYRNAPAAETSAATASENARIKQMLRYLQENYTRRVTVAELAAHANICERECLRCFQKVLHLSPIQYLIRYRIARSCILLRESDLSVLEISNLCGFESPSYFTKTFRQITGGTPTQYRRAQLIP